MKKIIRIMSLMLVVAMTASLFMIPSYADRTAKKTDSMPFKDVSEEDWYYTYVEYVYQNGMFSGTSDTTFEPLTEMTRAMFVRLFANLDSVDLTKYTETKFTDVDMSAWYGSAVAWAEANKVVNGTSETTFEPDQNITREQMCVLLVNYAAYAGIDLTLDTPKDTAFTDADEVSSWAKDAVIICAAAGIINGKGDGRFDPQGTATRSEVAALCTNFHTLFVDDLELWFDHSTVKTAKSDTESTGKDTYTMYMAKNEVENGQFVLASKNGHDDLTVTVSAFKDGAGNQIETELLYGWYTKMYDTYTPDALPPVQGPMDIKAGTSQCFYIKVRTDEDTKAGTYSAAVEVKNKLGAVIKTAEISLNVWDFTLDDNDAPPVTADLNHYEIYTAYQQYDSDDRQLYKMYYDFLLENHVCAYDLPYTMDDERVDEYLNNPRVRCFAVDYTGYGTGHDIDTEYLKRAYSKLSANPEWFSKGYFYYVDEPLESGKLLQIGEYGSMLESVYPGYRMISPFERTWLMAGEPLKCYSENNTPTPQLLTGDSSAGIRYQVAEGKAVASFEAWCPSWSDNKGEITFSVYEWKGNYASSVASAPVVEKTFVDYPDNDTLSVITVTEKHPDGLTAGDYLFLIHDGVDSSESGVGVWCYPKASDPAMTVYMNGEVSTSNLAPAMTFGISDISSGAAIGDSIEYMKDYIKIWVPRCWAYTDESLRGTEGALFIDSPEQVELLGDYASRINELVETRGDEAWWYWAGKPYEPYATFHADSLGILPRIIGWQMQEYDVTGLLYYSVTCWGEMVGLWSNINNVINPNLNLYGNGVLIYPGIDRGIREPISSIRLENLRDGIEDYMYLEMIGRLCGEEKRDEYVAKITTNLIEYSTDDAYLQSVRIEMGNMIEAAMNS